MERQRHCMELLQAQWDDGKFLCVGLDPSLGQAVGIYPDYPHDEALFLFNRGIVNATKHVACAYKPNFGFYAGHGPAGLRALSLTVDHIRLVAPAVPIILDAKVGDIGPTNTGYARMRDAFQADAITVHPYLGQESLLPLTSRADKGVFILCRTSNPGAREFQDLRVSPQGIPLFAAVAHAVAERWNELGNCGLVVGATYPDELSEIRRIAPELPLLIPGIGTQGGSLAEAVSRGTRGPKRDGILLNVSSGLLKDGLDAVGAMADYYHNCITEARTALA